MTPNAMGEAGGSDADDKTCIHLYKHFNAKDRKCRRRIITKLRYIIKDIKCFV